ncbi:hypothetical protein PAAG_12148 [Paracoccidioides lutzii Pb01]|uniref:Uncharacterized protein n=1 Tax=Paracoccidioides lutzii (strain ATCC MYA-826 / Pb01) TaxID=502779 RepID=A0A0A2V0A3_PARBA|nr:hypothetical protein PAAG_12148 [Paracoccidioides lutzii Pb01]KGQ01201.1 hypothetical protein PAAG_12148 [Paracoccidioides lutzii Pb01]
MYGSRVVGQILLRWNSSIIWILSFAAMRGRRLDVSWASLLVTRLERKNIFIRSGFC